MVDQIDEIIISALSQDCKQSTFEIWDFLKKFKIDLTEEEIESRISKLESDKVIKGYTISVDAKKIPHKVIQSLPKRMEGLKKYLKDAPFVLFSGKTRGGYDWITIKSFLSNDMADEENDIYRNLFGDIIQTYEVYDFVPQTDASLYALAYTEKEYKEDTIQLIQKLNTYMT